MPELPLENEVSERFSYNSIIMINTENLAMSGINLANKKRKNTASINTSFNPEYCTLLIEHCESGHSLETFSGVYNISPDKIVQWAMEYPNFKDAAKIALTKQMYYWECQLLEGMKSGEKSQIECAKLMITSFKNVTENKIRESLYDDYKEQKQEKLRNSDTDIAKELEAKLDKLDRRSDLVVPGDGRNACT